MEVDEQRHLAFELELFGQEKRADGQLLPPAARLLLAQPGVLARVLDHRRRILARGPLFGVDEAREEDGTGGESDSGKGHIGLQRSCAITHSVERPTAAMASLTALRLA